VVEPCNSYFTTFGDADCANDYNSDPRATEIGEALPVPWPINRKAQTYLFQT